MKYSNLNFLSANNWLFNSSCFPCRHVHFSCSFRLMLFNVYWMLFVICAKFSWPLPLPVALNILSELQRPIIAPYYNFDDFLPRTYIPASSPNSTAPKRSHVCVGHLLFIHKQHGTPPFLHPFRLPKFITVRSRTECIIEIERFSVANIQITSNQTALAVTIVCVEYIFDARFNSLASVVVVVALYHVTHLSTRWNHHPSHIHHYHHLALAVLFQKTLEIRVNIYGVHINWHF